MCNDQQSINNISYFALENDANSLETGIKEEETQSVVSQTNVR